MEPLLAKAREWETNQAKYSRKSGPRRRILPLKHATQLLIIISSTNSLT